jgi:hypothetical protein
LVRTNGISRAHARKKVGAKSSSFFRGSASRLDKLQAEHNENALTMHRIPIAKATTSFGLRNYKSKNRLICRSPVKVGG